MNRMLSCSTALALVLSASGALADVTPEEVWESWQALSTAAGQELTVGGTAKNGDTLEVTGVVMTFKDETGGSASASFDKLSFKDNGDGTVAVTMSDSYPITLAFPDEGDGPSSMKLTVSQPGMAITAGGTATETNYEFVAPVVAVKLDEVKDETGTVLDVQADFAMTEMTSKYLVIRDGEKTDMDTSFAAKAIALNVAGKDPEGTGQGTVTLSLTDLSGATKGNFLGAEIMANMAMALNSGFTMDTNFTYGMMALNVDITDESGPVKMTGSSTGGSFVLAMDKTRVNYGTSVKGLNLSASGAEIPFPEVVVSLSEAAFNVLMPVSKSDTPQDFAFLTKVVDFTISDDVWGLVDPGGILSREPATVIFDVKGTGFWTKDIMDPGVQMDVEPPGELTSLDITQILGKAAGAEVGATGALTFDNTDLTTFQGVPAPSGSIDVSIKGVSKLVDNLIAMGIITEDDAMGVRMMLGMFTRPGAGPDEVTSLIEFKDGGLFANGQQLQ